MARKKRTYKPRVKKVLASKKENVPLKTYSFPEYSITIRAANLNIAKRKLKLILEERGGVNK